MKLKKLLLIVVLLSNIAAAAQLATEYYEIKNIARVDFYNGYVFSTVYSNQVIDKVETDFPVRLVIEGAGTTVTPELYKGGVIDYKIIITVEGIGTVKDIVITNPIPVDTTYELNTLKVDGVFSEPYFGSNKIIVPLGNMTRENRHVIEFSVKVI